jgi:hypothetical protein
LPSERQYSKAPVKIDAFSEYVLGERDRGTALLLSHQTDFLVGWYCDDESQRHQSLLRALLIEKGAK